MSGGLGNQLTALGSKLEAMKQTSAGLGKAIKMQSSKVIADTSVKELSIVSFKTYAVREYAKSMLLLLLVDVKI